MNILFLGTNEDNPYLFKLREAIGAGHKTRVNLTQVQMLSEVTMICKQYGIDSVITTQKSLIPRLASTASSKEQTIDNYAGSLLKDTKSGISYLFVNPLKQCVTLPYGQFMLNRYVSKLVAPSKWLGTDKFNWKLCEGKEFANCYTELTNDNNLFCSIDIETRKDLSISSISYTIVTKYLTTSTYVIPLPYGLSVEEYEYRFAWIEKFNATSIPKLGQNFKYDIAYLNLFGCPVTNWLFDTAVCHHSWYAELPKDLGTIGAFYIRESCFWKNEGDGNEWDGYNYNAYDTWYTAWIFLVWLAEAPNWAVKNYLIEFPVLIPCVLSEATGLKVDMDKFRAVRDKQKGIFDRELSELQASIGVPRFNPGSSKQCKQLLTILGHKDLASSSDEKTLLKAAYRHPFSHWILDKVLSYRKAAKLISTYLNEDKFFKGRLLYNLAPYGTKTGRLASTEHAFWCGFQIQNIPRKGGIKSYLIADEGFLIGEADYAQAESRDTGYISGDTVLIEAVDGVNDFHSFNASSFFGIPYEQICQNLPDGSYKILDPEIRQLSKPINHGKNYNMGDGVLVDTMGLENIFKAAKRLGLSKNLAPKQIAAHLGRVFANTYKVLTTDYYNWVKFTVTNSRLLIGATGWTRYCFGDPVKNKNDLNAYIAHPPQSLNAMTLNMSYCDVFWKVWVPNHENFKLCAQIHDSILFQYRIGHEYLAKEVEKCMVRDVEVTDIKGITRTLRVPVDVKLGGVSWKD